MSHSLYLPIDEIVGGETADFDLAADYLEVLAATSDDTQSFTTDLIDVVEVAAERDYKDVDEEMQVREDVAKGAADRIDSRMRSLGTAYPFSIDASGALISYIPDTPDIGQAAYLASLLLSNLDATNPFLRNSAICPSQQEIDSLRTYFQYFATAALAAEVQGPAWSFGFPRPDGSGFIAKLKEIWAVINDGKVKRHLSAPKFPKDDQVDIFACRERIDGLPGFVFAAAQVATGQNWKAKSLKSHIIDAFPNRWFEEHPATKMIPYHVVPFARKDDLLRDDVLVVGNIMHRTRVARRVAESVALVSQGIKVEAHDQLSAAIVLIDNYLKRVRPK